MNKFLLIARHELMKHLRRPSFIILTLALPLVGFIVTVVAGTVNRNNDPTQLPGMPTAPDSADMTLGYVDHAGIITSVPDDIHPDLFRAFPDETSARAAVEAGEIDAFYVLAENYLETGTVTRIAPQVEFGFADIDQFDTLMRANLLSNEDPRIGQRVDSPLNLETTQLDTDGQVAPPSRSNEDNEDNPLRFLVPYIFAMLLFFTIISGSSFMLQSVTEEKENRTMEILLTSLKPWQLLAGKVVGLGILSLLQMIVWISAGRVLLTLSTGTFGLFASFDLPIYVLLLALIYFLLGYLIYASLMAGVGATVPSTREGTQLTFLVIFPLIVPLWFLGAIIERPESILAIGLSLFPLTAPVTMVMRIALTSVAWWNIALSLLLMAGTVILVIWGSARLFRATTLLAGKRFNLGEIVRTLREGAAA